MFYISKIVDNTIYVTDSDDLVTESYTKDYLVTALKETSIVIYGYSYNTFSEVFCFELMNKDNKAGVFILDSTEHCIYEDIIQRPLDFSSVISWIESRRIFSCARDVKAFFKSLGIETVIQFAELFSCISLHDTFWVKNILSNKTWSDVSPYRNDYSKFVSQYSIDGIIGTKDFNYISPDIATSGSFPSAWFYRDINNIEYYKCGSKFTLPASNSGFEPYSEYYASKVSEYLGFRHVDYRLKLYRHSDDRKEVITTCKSYTNEGVGAISASALRLLNYSDVLTFCKHISSTAFDTCLNMLFIDCLLLNTDRHFGNIEFLFNTDTLEIFDIAPIFDNNFSLLPRFVPRIDTFNRADYKARDDSSFEDLYEMISRYKDFKPYLRKLKDFNFEKAMNYPDEKLDFINKFLKMQIKYLGGLV